VTAGLVAAGILLPFNWLESPRTSSRIATVPVVVAAKDMPEGVAVDRMALVVAQWPAGTQPAGAYGSVDSVASRVTRVPVYKGEAFVPGRLAPEGTGAGLEVKITPGKRAYGIRINDVASLAGMVQPNSRVDIMVVIDDPEEKKRVAKLFMENMRVLAIGAAPERAQNGAPISAAVASIEVTPKEAERLAIAAAQGTLQLVLRGYADAESVITKAVDDRTFLRGLERSKGGVKRSRPAAPQSVEPLPLPRPDTGRAILLLTQPPIYVDPGHRHLNQSPQGVRFRREPPVRDSVPNRPR
jgi:pilus assembly protein CpaB